MKYVAVLHRLKLAHHDTSECVGAVVAMQSPWQQHHTKTAPTPFLTHGREYPFDHSHKYWAESRLSKEWRLREHGANNILEYRFHDDPYDVR